MPRLPKYTPLRFTQPAHEMRWPGFLLKANPYERGLFLGGAGAVIVGATIWLTTAATDQHEKQVNEMTVSFGGFGYYDPSAGQSHLGLMYFGIALAVLGALALVAFVAIRAAKADKPASRRKEPGPQSAKENEPGSVVAGYAACFGASAGMTLSPSQPNNRLPTADAAKRVMMPA
ncbi:hypothetical protein [Cryobacterium sp. MDB2-33-2]|uniref:hypothetical protein n=1 Tax=Cryobacterium sp. MDB2-33-2 TaxID=1259179 RepID=UPI00106A2425|nr:hypothetical protein [Cryobacterium sp. MDB2-33-2]TFC06550.1 hypothetical protein E3O59_10265 [Cryobacterium sp. MDB2-33-2]